VAGALTVRAAVCRTHGPPEVVVVEDRLPPEIGTGQALVRVEAAALNFPDVLIVANEYQVKIPTPFTPGSEFAGVVEAMAGDTGAIAVGDRVIGTGFVGAIAEQLVVPATSLVRIPDGVDTRTAAAFGVAYRTAYHVLRSVARVQPGDELIALGAGSGVGLATVQLGVLLGARVTAVASSQEKLDVAATYGAEHLIDHRRSGLRDALRQHLPDGADIVVDPVGGSLAEPALRTLHWGGRFVTVGYASGEIPRIPLNLVLLKGVQILGFELGSFSTKLPDELARNEAELRELLAAGEVVPHVGAVFPLEDVAAALRHVADGRAIGKVVIEMC
jgi:NADPH2:quinone reductase